MNTKTTIRDKIDAGYYENKVTYSKQNAEAYRVENAELRKQFKADCELEHGLTNHPKSDRLFDLAWEHGHSSGWSEIINYYEDFADLLK